MATNQVAVSFDEIIQAGKHLLFRARIPPANVSPGRQRKEQEKLANDILGQGRREKQKLAEEIFGRGRSSNASNNAGRKSAAGSTLASRVGVAKVRRMRRQLCPRDNPLIGSKGISAFVIHSKGEPQYRWDVGS